MSNGLNLPFQSGPVGTDGAVFQINQGDAATGQGGIAIVGNSFGSDRFGNPAVGVSAFSDVGDGVFATGKNGVHGESQTPAGCGVWGNNSGGGSGVSGSTSGGQAGLDGVASGAGVLGRSDKATGVMGTSTNGVGVFGSGGFLAGRFIGNVGVTGNLQASGDLTVRNITASGDICLVQADCAEDFEVADIASAAPGTVMVLQEGGAVRESDQPYDTRVAGVVAGAGGFRPGIILDRECPKSNRRPLALMGKVYCWVDAEYGPIVVGDLLTTSATPGHAMKVDDRTKAFGAVIGKALGGLTKGTGLIPVLVGLR